MDYVIKRPVWWGGVASTLAWAIWGCAGFAAIVSLAVGVTGIVVWLGLGSVANVLVSAAAFISNGRFTPEGVPYPSATQMFLIVGAVAFGALVIFLIFIRSEGAFPGTRWRIRPTEISRWNKDLRAPVWRAVEAAERIRSTGLAGVGMVDVNSALWSIGLSARRLNALAEEIMPVRSAATIEDRNEYQSARANLMASVNSMENVAAEVEALALESKLKLEKERTEAQRTADENSPKRIAEAAEIAFSEVSRSTALSAKMVNLVAEIKAGRR